LTFTAIEAIEAIEAFAALPAQKQRTGFIR
jgi:hypothetical protein